MQRININDIKKTGKHGYNKWIKMSTKIELQFHKYFMNFCLEDSILKYPNKSFSISYLIRI